MGHHFKERDVVVDAARGICIVLVVSWHVNETSFFGLNESLILLRMPLFFFIAGLFAAAAMTLQVGDFLKRKVSHLLYLYVLWAFLLYLGSDLVREFVYGSPYTFTQRFLLFTEPPPTIWFLYALAVVYLVGWLTYHLPPVLILAVAFAAYAYSIYTYPLNGIPFLHKVLRALPFFLIALHYGRPLVDAARLHARRWFLLFPLFLAFATLTVQTELGRIGIVTLVLGLFGIVATIGWVEAFRASRAVAALAYVGQRSFYVYAMHRSVITVAAVTMATFQIPHSAWTDLGRVVLAVGLTLLVGEKIIRPHFKLLEVAPWNTTWWQQRVFKRPLVTAP